MDVVTIALGVCLLSMRKLSIKWHCTANLGMEYTENVLSEYFES